MVVDKEVNPRFEKTYKVYKIRMKSISKTYQRDTLGRFVRG